MPERTNEAGTVSAGRLLEVWSFRLKMDRKRKRWAPQLVTAVEKLVGGLEAIPRDERIALDADVNRNPIARFIRVSTGEVIGEINKAI